MSSGYDTTNASKPTQSILLTVKKMLGIAEEYHAFDLDIIVNINSVFLTLNQLGVGPTMPYQISDTEQTWMDFLGDQMEFLAGVQMYVYLRTRLLFDPPTNSFLVDSMRKQCDELEWRFTVQPKTQQEIDYVENFRESVCNQNGSKEEVDQKDESTKESPDMKEISLFNKTSFRKLNPYDIFS